MFLENQDAIGLISFIRENQQQFYRLAFSYVRDSETAMDLVQDAIVKAIQNMHTLRQPDRLKTWFYRILVNECLMYLRKNRKLLPIQSLEQELAAPEQGNQDLHEAISQLPPHLRTIILLRFFEGMKLEEIARITRTNLSTVKSRLYKALKLLRLEMEDKP